MTLPDKHVRKAFYDRIHNMDVDGQTIKCFDSKATNFHGDNYIILGLQTNVEKHDKCKGGWRSTILVEIFTRLNKNSGSRTMADDMIQEALDLLEDLNLPSSTNLVINNISRSTPNDITSETLNEVVHRKFLRYEMDIQQL